METSTNYNNLDVIRLVESFTQFQNKLMLEVPELKFNEGVVSALELCQQQIRTFCTKDLSEPKTLSADSSFIHQMKLTLANLDDLVFVLTPELEIAYLSPNVEELLRYSRKELLGQPFYDLLPLWDDKNRTTANLLNMTLYKNIRPVRKKLSTAKGELTWFELKLSAIAFSEDKNNCQGFLLMARNIEEQVKKEDILIHERRMAESNNKLKSEYLANMSHEIRTPLNGIVGFSNILTHKKVDDQRRKRYVRNIESCSKQLMTLINDIIDLSKIESGKIKFHFTEFDLHALLNDLKEYYTNEVCNAGKPLKIKLIKPNKKKAFAVKMDEVRLRQVLINLLNNALKFTENGSIDFGYKIASNGYLHFFVRDTGNGVPVEFQPYVFDAHKQSAQTKHGSGLGLAISKGLIEGLNGQIQLNTQPGKGTEFTFQLPISA